MLELKQLCIHGRNKTLIENLSVTVHDGEVLALMGPSGSGKSSLLSFLSGTLPQTMSGSGEVVLNGKHLESVPPENRDIGLLQQNPLLFTHMTVEENVLFALTFFGSRFERKYKARELLAEVGLEGFEDQTPDQLSGGQQARLALVRTLSAEPKMLLLDEPFSKLDKELRQEVRSLVLEKIKAANIPTILVTHDDEDAEHLAKSTISL